MSKDNLINEDFKVLDFDECVNKHILFKSMYTDDNVAPEASESIIDNRISNNIYSIHVDCGKINKSKDKNSQANVYQIHSNSLESDLKISVLDVSNNITENANDTIRYVNNNVTNNFDIISIISDEDCVVTNDETRIPLLREPQKLVKTDNYTDSIGQIVDSDCSDYHSSDFEFITENEANLRTINNSYCKNVHGTKKFTPVASGSVPSSLKYTTNKSFLGEGKYFEVPRECDQGGEPSRIDPVQYGPSCSNAGNMHIDSLQPGPSSCSNGPTLSNNILQNNYPVHKALPDGEDYLDLFRGIYAPVLPLCNIHMMENKSFRTTSMNVEFEGIGFDMRLMRNMDDSSQDEYESEAEENVKRILRMYPGDNRKLRRRH